MTSWVDVKGEFVRDSFCFREIHVLDATHSDWQRMLAALPKSTWGWVYKYDEKVTALPTSFAASLQKQGSPYSWRTPPSRPRGSPHSRELECDLRGNRWPESTSMACPLARPARERPARPLRPDKSRRSRR